MMVVPGVADRLRQGLKDRREAKVATPAKQEARTVVGSQRPDLLERASTIFHSSEVLWQR
jgi:hypothetical protein